MMNTHLRMTVMAALLGAPFLPARSASAQQSLRLNDIYQQVRERNPRLQAAASLVKARQALQPAAGVPSDPQLEIGAMNFSLPGLSATMPSSMVPSIKLMQMLPLFGKLGLNSRIAQQSTDIARADAGEAWWEVRAEAAMDFFDVYRTDRELVVMKETLKLLQDYRKIAQAMYSAGEGKQADVLRASVEVARMEAEIKRAEAMRTGAFARLNGVVNQSAQTVLGTPELPALPAEIPAVDTLRAWAEAARPMLARGRAEISQASTRVSLAKKEIWPDVSVGIQYGQRRAAMTSTDALAMPEYATERMGSVMLGFTVPVFAGKRQLKMREEAEAMRQMAQADLARMRSQVDARIGELVADLERNRTLVELYNTDVLPQANANVQSAFSSYRVGQVDFMTLVDAQMTVNKYKQELVALVAEYGADVAELEMTIGRELPVTPALRAEEK